MDKKKLLVDGLGYDKELKQYFTNCYAWSYSDICYEGNDFIGKSGISKEDVLIAMAQATPTRGKQLQTNPHFGFESDRKYLPVGITQSEANQIVHKMDTFFKEDMKEQKWVYRDRKKIKEFGTEFYIGPKDIWIETIKEKWNDSLIKATSLVLGFSENKNLGDLQTLGSQGVVTEQISESLEINPKIRVIIPCGYGKGFLMFAGPHKWTNFKNKKTLVYYTHNIPATKQLALKHSEYALGTVYHGQIKRYVVCSETKNVMGQIEHGIMNISVSDNELDNVIREHLKFTQRVAFYVNKMSAGAFNKRFNKIASELGYNTYENVARIIDESQEITGNKYSTKVQAISDPIDSILVSFTATERRRGQDNNTNRIYNDDEQYFGVVAVEIFPSQTIQEGRSCPIHFKTVEVSLNHELMREIEKNSTIETLFNDNYSVEVRGRLLRGIVCLVKSINEDNRNHPLLVTNYRSDTEDAIKMIQILKDFEIIPADFNIVRAFREDGLDSAKQFNKETKSIMVGTPWVITGIDAPKTDGFIPLYDMGSEITATQGVGRGQRKHLDKNLIVYIPVNPDSSEIPTMLRVANNFILGQNSHNFGKENVESEEKTVYGSPKRSLITSEIDKDANSDKNLRIYWDKVYEDLTNNSIGSASSYLKKEFLPFAQAKMLMIQLNLTSKNDYYKIDLEGLNLPSSPRTYYQEDGWLSWPDFLGYKEGFHKFASLSEIVEYCKNNGITNSIQYKKLYDEGILPINFPKKANKYTKTKSWAEFFGGEKNISQVWTKETAIEIALTYTQKNKFAVDYPGCFKYIVRHNLENEAFVNFISKSLLMSQSQTKTLTKEEILDAQSKFKTADEIAKYLNCSFSTYKRESVKHGVYRKTGRWDKKTKITTNDKRTTISNC